MKLRVKKKKFKQLLLQNGVEVERPPFVRQYEMNMEYAHLPYPFYYLRAYLQQYSFDVHNYTSLYLFCQASSKTFLFYVYLHSLLYKE